MPRKTVSVPSGSRAQSNVVGVAVLIGITMLSLGALTAAVGTVVESNAAAVDADRVADDLDAAVRPVETTGVHEGRVSFTDGELRTVDRTVRVRDGDAWTNVSAGGLVFEAGAYRVIAVGGAVVRDHGGSASMYRPPRVAVSEEVALLGVADLRFDGHTAVSGTAPTTVAVRTNVSHDRRELGETDTAVAVETDAPGAWERHFDEAGATVTRRSFAGDEHGSVVATFDDERTAYLVLHEVAVEVDRV